MDTLKDLFFSVAGYLAQMSVLAVPGALAFFCFLPPRHQRLRENGLRSDALREAMLLLFVMTVCGILAVTLRPPKGWFTPLPTRTDPWDNVNLTPFRMFRVYKAYWRFGNLLYIIINFLGNMLVFLPVGFFPALLFRRAGWWRSALFGGLLSVFVECGQYFVMRQSDIDDVMLNTLGALAGYWVFLLIRRILPGIVPKFRCQTIS